MTTRRCGRLGRHDAHDWPMHAWYWMGRRQPARAYRCNGHVVTEGGAS